MDPFNSISNETDCDISLILIKKLCIVGSVNTRNQIMIIIIIMLYYC